MEIHDQLRNSSLAPACKKWFNPARQLLNATLRKLILTKMPAREIAA